MDRRVIELQQALLGSYSLERELGRGGMGVVYLAREIRLDRPVAIKVLHAELAARPEARRRFVQEARTAARLAHPHIVPIYSVEERGTLVYFVMALVDGETLGQRIRRRGALAPDEAERALRETAWALGYAHAHGIVHRDLTLENILIERHSGRALLGDFGIAGERDAVDGEPVFGTPGYLAPEVIRGEPADARSDLYALGVVGFTALAGRAPFEAATSAQLLAKHLMQPVPPLASSARGASRRLVAAVECCLRKDAADRPPDTAALLTMLERAPEPVTVAAPLRTWFTRWDRIRPIYALATPVLALQTWLMIDGYFQSGLRMLLTVALITTILTLTAIPVAVHLLFEASELRRLRRFGFGVDDVRTAFPHWQREQVRQRRDEGLAPLHGRVLFDLTVVGAVVILFTFAVVWPNLWRWVVPVPGEIGATETALISMLSTVYLATLSGVGVGFLVPGHRASPAGWLAGVTQKFWRSRFAGMIAKLSALGQTGSLATFATLHRNTELVLGLAVEDLWKAIPDDGRRELGDVPALTHTLQRGAAELRELADRLKDSEAELDPADPEIPRLAAVRTTLEAQHRETVTALERLRLQLLRLLASKEHTADLTQQLEVARTLETKLLRDVAAHTDIRRMLHRVRREHRTSVTPTPTPSPA
jgi:eukaryotic-like serine/threonine-protein kinase